MVIKKLVNCTGLASAIAFAMLPALFMIAPVFQVAEETSAVTSVITVGEIMSLAVNENIDIDIMPSPTGTFSAGAGEVVAGGNFRGGYTLLMSSSSNPADMVAKDGSGNTIGTISNLPVDNPGYTVAGTLMPVNTYGFNIKSAAYSSPNSVASEEDYFSPVPTTDKLIAYTIDSGEITRTVSYGTRVDFDTPTGTYKNTITFTWVANYVSNSTPAFYSATSMQDMTPEICASVRRPTATHIDMSKLDTDGTHNNDYNYIPVVTLTDERDGNTYRVMRLYDSCYMLDSLKLTKESLEDNDVYTLDSTNTDLPDGVTYDVEDLLDTAEITPLGEDDEDGFEFDTDSKIAKYDYTYEDSNSEEHTETNYYYDSSAAKLKIDGETGEHQSICPAGWYLSSAIVNSIIYDNPNSDTLYMPNMIDFDDGDESNAGWGYGLIYKEDLVAYNLFSDQNRSHVQCALKR